MFRYHIAVYNFLNMAGQRLPPWLKVTRFTVIVRVIFEVSSVESKVRIVKYSFYDIKTLTLKLTYLVLYKSHKNDTVVRCEFQESRISLSTKYGEER